MDEDRYKHDLQWRLLNYTDHGHDHWLAEVSFHPDNNGRQKSHAESVSLTHCLLNCNSFPFLHLHSHEACNIKCDDYICAAAAETFHQTDTA